MGLREQTTGNPYCPNLAKLGGTGIDYIAASSPKPSDSAPGLMALVYPWNFLRTNTIFGVIQVAGGYTAWIDPHPSIP